MKTEIERSYRWGYLLTEQELRRIVQSAEEHMGKSGVTYKKKFLQMFVMER